MAIRKRGNKWTVKVYDQETQGQRWVGSYDTKALAVAAEQNATLGLSDGNRARTVADWSVIWLRDYPRSAPASRVTYEGAVKRIVQDIGAKKLTDIDRPAARRLANRWPNGVARVCRTMFADACRDGVILNNPFTALRLETPKGRKDLTALTADEIVSLADAALDCLDEYGPEFRALIIWQGYVGTRPGETCTLRREDLDVARGEITVRFTLDGQGGEKAPKNGRARVVTVPPPALAALAQVPVRLDSPYLFHSAQGKPLNKGTISYAFRLVRASWGKRDKLAMYELRHAAATMLMELGLPPHVVAMQLGHTDGGALVQRLYGHPSERLMLDQIHEAFRDSGANGEQAPSVLRSDRQVS
jgi:integrase